MIEGQTNIYDFINENYKIKKPIRLIEMFGGYGSQFASLKYLGANVEHWKLVEWAAKSIQAYNDFHIQDHTDYSKDLTDDEIIDKVYNSGVSLDYNKPATREQIKRQKYRTIYNNIIATKNLVDISRIKGKDLEITDKEHYEYILTYSFPCQDISAAGLGKGFEDTSTRSGLLWEVERILYELKETNQLPQILLMENVPLIHSKKHKPSFEKWIRSLESLGYSNYWQDLIATDYGIPQIRKRTFMISILGNYNYTFPKPIPLKLKLKDMLEDNVDEKYYLSDAMIRYFIRDEEGKFPRYERFRQVLKLTNEKNIAATITTGANNRVTDNFIINKNLEEKLSKNEIKEGISYIDTYNKKIRNDNLSSTITTRVKDTENYIEWEDGKNIQMNCRAWKEDKIVATLNTGGKTKILVKNATKKGYLEASDGDGIDISSRMQYHRGTVQKDKIQTLDTMGGESKGVVVQDLLKKDLCNKLIHDGLVEEGDVIKHSYTQQILDGKKKCVEKSDGIMITLTTRGDCVGTAVKDKSNNLRIRKLTPKECFRLMGVKDEDFENIAKNQSNASLYHLAGDSIVVNVLMAIFKELL